MPGLNIFGHESRGTNDVAKTKSIDKSQVAEAYAQQAERLARYTTNQEKSRNITSTQAVEANFVTGQDPIITTANGGRLPAVPVDEALKLNSLKDKSEGRDCNENIPVKTITRHAKDGTVHGILAERANDMKESNRKSDSESSLRDSVPSARTNPLFPPLPTFGPPRPLRTLQCLFFRTTSAVLSFCFLLVLLLGAVWTTFPMMFEHIRLRLLLQIPDKRRPFYEEEEKRKKARRAAEKEWTRTQKVEDWKKGQRTPDLEKEEVLSGNGDYYVPTEGGPDPLVCDVGYYARRVGLDVEYFDVETEDGFIIELWHVYNPREYRQLPTPAHEIRGPFLFHSNSSDPEYGESQRAFPYGEKKYPVLMIHGLLQSSGAYCCTEDDSLAFYLAKSGYDVWLGNNRCGFRPRHTQLEYGDPRMWAWNIRQMGVMDLPALTSRVLAETGFEKLGLVAHSQGTTQTLVALAKEQRPELGNKISVFCALAPAAYAGPLIGKAYFKFMRVINANIFRCVFGIHAFIPLMMSMHKILPGRLYGAMGYRIFSFLFNWTDTRWELDLRNRMFQFAPVYVSAESMRWWLGRDCFARQKCILATKEEAAMEDEEDEHDDEEMRKYYAGHPTDTEHSPERSGEGAAGGNLDGVPNHIHDAERGKYAWFDENFPPLALWVCGADDLVDGRRLLRRFDRGREPHVNVVHKKIIEGYEHLDVIWAMDSIEKVGREVKEVIWQTASEEARAACRTPSGCENVMQEKEKREMDEKNAVKRRSRKDSPAGIYLGDAEKVGLGSGMQSPRSPTQIDATAGEWRAELKEDVRRSKEDEVDYEVMTLE